MYYMYVSPPEPLQGLSGEVAVDHATGAALEQLALLRFRTAVRLLGVKGHLEQFVYVGVEVLLSEFRGDL